MIRLTPKSTIPAPRVIAPEAAFTNISPMPEPIIATPLINSPKGAAHSPTVMPIMPMITPNIGTQKIMQRSTKRKV